MVVCRYLIDMSKISIKFIDFSQNLKVPMYDNRVRVCIVGVGCLLPCT